MSAGSEAVLYDIFGDPMAVEVDTAIPAGTALLISGGSDGTNARYIKVDSSGNQVMIGLGTAGTPTGGVLTIQGDPSGTPAPISGTVTANAGSGNFSVVQATAALLNATVIGTVTANIGTSGALALDATLAKLTITPGTAIGSNTLAMIGGHVTTGSPTYTNGNINPLSLTTAGALRIDGSAVTQPISGTVTANQGGAPWSSNITQFGGVAISTGTGASGTGIPRVTVANDSNILATQSGTWTVQQGTPPWSVVGSAADGAALSGNPVRVAGSDGTNTQNIITDTTGRLLVSGAAADGAVVTGNPVLIGGQDGTNTQSILTDTLGRIVTVTASAAATNGFTNGEIILASTTITAIRSTTYTEPTSGAQRSMASSSASDTSAGTGARTVRITYYTLSAGTVAGPFTETITLNGTGNVNTVATNICYIEKLEVLTVGSGGVNAGTITLFAATAGGGGAVWTIAIGTNKTFGAHHYVSSSTKCNVTTFSGGIKGADTSGFILRVKDPTNTNSAEVQISDLLRAPSSGNTPVRTYAAPIEVNGPARITAFAIPDSSSSRTYYASFDFFEE